MLSVSYTFNKDVYYASCLCTLFNKQKSYRKIKNGLNRISLQFKIKNVYAVFKKEHKIQNLQKCKEKKIDPNKTAKKLKTLP